MFKNSETRLIQPPPGHEVSVYVIPNTATDAYFTTVLDVCHGGVSWKAPVESTVDESAPSPVQV